MRILLVVNSSASSVTARTRVVIQKALSAEARRSPGIAEDEPDT